jgi:hypothetical protein
MFCAVSFHSAVLDTVTKELINPCSIITGSGSVESVIKPLLAGKERSKAMDGLEFKEDGRSTEPNVDRLRKGNFKHGWGDATERDEEYTAETLKTLTWQNLGYRLGKLLGKTSEAIQEEMYEICVKQQEEKG